VHLLSDHYHWPARRRTLVFVAAFLLLFAFGHQATKGLGQRVLDREVARLIGSNRAFQLLDQHDSVFRRDLTEFARTVTSRSSTKDEAFTLGLAWGQKRLGPYMAKYLPQASDSTAVSFAKVLLDLLRPLARTDPETCIAYLFGQVEAASPVRPIVEDLQGRIMDAMAQVLEEGIRSPQPRVDSLVGAALVERLIIQIQSEYGDSTISDLALLADPGTAREEPARACKATVVLYNTVFTMPEATQGPTLRYLFAQD